MCLIIFAHQISPDHNLILAANRDELFSRPTLQAQLWNEEHSGIEILSGRDEQAGGTWIGVTRSGRFAAVTNIRDPLQLEKKPKSRGELTLNFLTSDMSPREYCQSLGEEFGQFAGYNLLVGDSDSLCYVNNFEEIVEELPPGIYGLSNGVLNSQWPKIINGKSLLTDLLSDSPNLTTDQLISIMNQRDEAPDNELPDTGVSLELERKLSPAFILNPEREYGTLCSTAIISSATGACRFSEQNYDSAGFPQARHYYEF